MNKPYIRDVMTVLGILLTVLIFLGGWRITEELFSRSKDILLAEVMYSQIYKADITSMEDNQPENQPEDSLETQKLSLEEMSEILKQCYPSDIDIFGNTQVTLADVRYITDTMAEVPIQWNPGDIDILSDTQVTQPSAEHVTMEQAFTSIQNSIDYFYEQELVRVGFFEDASMNACLKEKQSWDETLTVLQSSGYIYWAFLFEDEDMTFYAEVNAVTGEIWRIIIISISSMINFDDTDIDHLLHDYLDYLDLSEDCGYEMKVSNNSDTSITVSCDIGNGLFRAAAAKKNINNISNTTSQQEFCITSQEEEVQYFNCLYICLTS